LRALWKKKGPAEAELIFRKWPQKLLVAQFLKGLVRDATHLIVVNSAIVYLYGIVQRLIRKG